LFISGSYGRYNHIYYDNFVPEESYSLSASSYAFPQRSYAVNQVDGGAGLRYVPIIQISTPKIRKDFPETWIWETLNTE
jgi:hypothetical protein